MWSRRSRRETVRDVRELILRCGLAVNKSGLYFVRCFLIYILFDLHGTQITMLAVAIFLL